MFATPALTEATATGRPMLDCTFVAREEVREDECDAAKSDAELWPSELSELVTM